LTIFAQLAAPFPPERVSWRVGSTNAEKTRGMALAYIDARDVQDRLQQVMGAHWQNRFVPMSNGTMCCEIGLLLEGDWLWRSNGAGATDFEGEKGAYSDAFKRAAVMWGVGRYLYDLDAPWVAVEAKGRSVFIKKDELPALQALLRGDKPKSAHQAHKDGDYKKIETALRACANATRLSACWKANQATIATWPAGWRQAITEEKDACKAALEKQKVPA
jgi:hypothetical protein